MRVGGVTYPTVITDDGVQRFVEDPLLARCFECGALDLNKLGIAYQLGTSGLTQREYAELNMKLGYSVGGFCDLSSFQDLEIENPLWNSPRKEVGSNP